MQEGCDAPVFPKTAKGALKFHPRICYFPIQHVCPVFHHSLPQYLSNEMEMLQKRALQIMQPDLSYADALVALDITSLYERRKALSNALFDQIVRDQSHKLLSSLELTHSETDLLQRGFCPTPPPPKQESVNKDVDAFARRLNLGVSCSE